MRARVIIGTFMLILLAHCANFVYSQAPQGFSYQAVVRDGSGVPIAKRDVSFQFTLQNSSKVPYYTERKILQTNEQGVVNHIIGSVTPTFGTFADIPWETGDICLKVEIDPLGGVSFTAMGEPTKIQSVPYALFADNAKEVVSPANATDEEPIFVVKNKLGQIVFAVYQTGVRVYVEDTGVKGVRGGFAVGGLTNQKLNGPEYFRITPDSARVNVNEVSSGIKGVRGGFAVGGLTNQKATSRDLLYIAPDSARIYIDNSITPKGVRGGFAVGGLTNQKLGNPEYLRITPDSTRIYINDSPTPKGVRGGFAVGGLTNQKGGNANFFNIETGDKYIINPTEARILWYPLKHAFLTGDVLILDPNDVGLNSFASGYQSKAKGQYSQALGYQAAANGDYSTSIGKNTTANGNSSFAFGDGSTASNNYSYAFGKSSQANGQYSFAFGESVIAGSTTSITNAYAFGRKSQAKANSSYAMGDSAIAIGANSFAFGRKAISNGGFSYAFGDGASTGPSGVNSFALGKSAQANGSNSFAIGEDAVAKNPNSYAIGKLAEASGDNAIAIGFTAIATGPLSVAINGGASGQNSFAVGGSAIGANSRSFGGTAEGEGSLSSGNYAYAKGKYSIALGERARGMGDNSVAIGTGNIQGGFPPTYTYTEANGKSAVAMGVHAVASGEKSVAIGFEPTASGFASLAMGTGVTAKSAYSTAIGFLNVGAGTTEPWTPTDPLFEIGNGISGVPSNAFTVLKNGNTGIGTTSISNKLEVAGGVNLNSGIATGIAMKVNGSEVLWYNGTFLNWGYGATYTNFATPVNIGSVDNHTTYKLWVNGDAWFVGAHTSSDIRWKKNITPLNNVLPNLLQLKGVKYEWRTEEYPKMNFDNRIHIGFIAQEVEKLFPELVMTDNDGFKSVAYDKLSAILLEGMKEQQKQIDELKEKNKEIDALKAELEAIKAMLKK